MLGGNAKEVQQVLAGLEIQGVMIGRSYGKSGASSADSRGFPFSGVSGYTSGGIESLKEGLGDLDWGI